MTDALRAALWSLHQSDHDQENDETWCSSCGVSWPCPTAELLRVASRESVVAGLDEHNELPGMARAALATLRTLLDSTSATDDSTPLYDLIEAEWGRELMDFLDTADETLERLGYARLAAARLPEDEQ